MPEKQSVIAKLASSLGRRDETPNVELGNEIAASGDKIAVQELVDNLKNKDKGIQADCIKALYEIGERKPEMVAHFAPEFIALLDSKNKRLVWGAMTAIDSITLQTPKTVFGSLAKIIAKADAGTVITKDHAVSILAKLGTIKEYANDCFALLNEQILRSPVNQLPTYAEKTAAIVNDKNKPVLLQILLIRLEDVSQEPKRKRLEKVIKKLK